MINIKNAKHFHNSFLFVVNILFFLIKLIIIIQLEINNAENKPVLDEFIITAIMHKANPITFTPSFSLFCIILVIFTMIPIPKIIDKTLYPLNNKS